MAATDSAALPEGGASIAGRTFKGFGTTVGAWTTEPALLDSVEIFMKAWVERVEAACSRFDPLSDLSRVNAGAGTAVRVGPELVSAVGAALAMADVTGGLYDPTVGGAVISAGYDRSFDQVTAMGPGPEGPAMPGGAWPDVELDVDAGTLMVPGGFQLDLGGSAKGWAVDMALRGITDAFAVTNPGAGYCVSAGGDLGVSGAIPGDGWPVSITERLDGSASDLTVEVRLRRGAMATSGATARRWTRAIGSGHHIIDPRTGLPGTSPWRLVTVFSDSCIVSDTAATAAWLLGPEAVDWLNTMGLGARLVDQAGISTWVGETQSWLAGGRQT